MRNFISYIFISLIIFAGQLWGQQISVFATTDSIEYFVGDYIEYQLQVKYDKNLEVIYPSVKDSIDVLDFIRELTPSKNEVDGKIIEVKRFVFSNYDSAEVVIPSFAIDYRAKGSSAVKTIRTNPVTIMVKTLDVDSQADIQDVKDPLKISFDWLFWGIIVIIFVIVVTIVFYFYRRYKKKKDGLPVKKVKVILPPYRIALDELRELEKSKLWQQGQVKEYHLRITYIIRKYFESRFHFDALEMPSSEVLENLRQKTDSSGIYDKSRSFFENADLVKFAKFQPMPSVNDEMMEQAYDIVNKTKIEEESKEEIVEEIANV